MQRIQGAILRVKLRHLEDWTEARRTYAGRYRELVSDLSLELPREMGYGRHVYHLFVVRSARRTALQEALQKNGIQWGIHYPKPVHLQLAYADLGYGQGVFPQAERAAREVLSIPMFPELTEEQIVQVAGAIRSGIDIKLDES